MSARERLGRIGPILLALVFLGAAFAHAFYNEPPLGRIEGNVVIVDGMRPLPGVEVYLTSADGRNPRTRYCTTDQSGRFAFPKVLVGEYRVSAASQAYRVEGIVVTVVERATSPVLLTLGRSQPNLQVAQHRRSFGTTESVSLFVHGYVDGAKPRGQDALRFTLYHTRLSSVLRDASNLDRLSRVTNAYGEPAELPSELLVAPDGQRAQVARQVTLPITQADREGFFREEVRLGSLNPGLYLAQIEHGSDRVPDAFVVSNTALVVKRANRQVVAYTVDLNSGAPLAETRIEVLRQGSIVARAVTDAQGLARAMLPTMPGQRVGDEPEEPTWTQSRAVVIARRGADEAVAGRYYDEEEGASGFAVHIYTDRPIYRPGHTIHFKAIVRQSGQQGYIVPSGLPVSLEVRDPNGEPVHRAALTTNRYGSVFGSFVLSAEAPTGVYSVLMKAGRSRHTHDLVVASYKKPEFQVEVRPVEKRVTRGTRGAAEVRAEYYFGAPVAGAKVRYYIYANPDWSAEFPDEYGWESQDEESLSAERYGGIYGSFVAEGTAVLDENGRATIPFDTRGAASAPSVQAETYTISATVQDSSGRESSAEASVQVTASDLRVTVAPEGYLAEPGKPFSLVVKVGDYEGRPAPNRPVELTIALERRNRDRRDYSAPTFTYVPVGALSGTTDANGAVLLTFTPRDAGSLRLEAAARDDRNRPSIGRAFIYSARDGVSDLNTEYADLSVHLDKRRYRPGDTARVLINAQRTGQSLLLTVEGKRVFETSVVPLRARSTVVRIPVREEFGPNAYVSACYVRDRKFARSEAQLLVALPEKELTVTVAPDHVSESGKLPRYKPGDPVTLRIRTADAQGRGVPAEVSLGVVDEAIYALREENPNALRRAFYPRRYNQVSTDYSFELVMLGDADKAEPKIVARKKFEDTAYWNPALVTDSSGSASVTFRLPDNLTTWRATAQAVTLQTALGRQASKLLVTKDLFVRLERPRLLTQLDQSRLRVIVHNETDSPRLTQVRLRAVGLNIMGADTQRVTVQPRGTATVDWQVEARDIGDARVTATAWTFEGTAANRPLTDGVEVTLPVQPHGREVLQTFAGEIAPGATETETCRLDAAAVPSATRLVVRITPSLRGAIAQAAEYLRTYPYACTEQTMSRLMPAIWARHMGNGAPDKDASTLLRDGLTRLYRLQHGSGGWGWWEYDADDPWMTAYVLIGMAAARQAGHSVSDEAIHRARKALADLLGRTTPENRGFLRYALAVSGGAVAREVSPPEREPAESLAYHALAALHSGQDARPLLEALRRRVVMEGSTAYWKPTTNRWGWSEWSRVMTTSAAVMALAKHDASDPLITKALRWLMLQRMGGQWADTRDTAWAVSAIIACLGRERLEEASGAGTVTVRLNGRVLTTVSLSGEQEREEFVQRVPTTIMRPDKNDVQIQREGGSCPLFYTVQFRQVVAAATLPPLQGSPVAIQREYRRVKLVRAGEGWRVDTEPLNGMARAGDQIRVRIRLKVPHEMAYLLIKDPYPAGLEVTERGSADETVDWNYWFTSIDVRDDHVAFFVRRVPAGEHVIEYNLRAQTPGRYRALPTSLNGMYVPDWRSESGTALLEIRP
jgi:uncharacterized protein YfaS (alpha-2-macroglobulin family)